MNCSTHPEAPAHAICTRCSVPLCDGCLAPVDDKNYCQNCAERVAARRAERQAAAASSPGGPGFAAPVLDSSQPIVPETPGSLARGLAFAAGGGVLGALIWYVAVIVTDHKIGFVAIGVGFLVGFAAHLGNGKQPSLPLAVASVAIAIASMMAGEYLMINHVFRKLAAGFGASTGNLSFDLFWLFYKESFSPMSLLFYAIGAFEAFRRPAAGATSA